MPRRRSGRGAACPRRVRSAAVRKPAGLAVGALLEWEGPTIASSIKNDLLQATVARRRTLGRVFVFNPFGISGEPTNTWTPLRGARTFDGALEVAHRLAAAREIDQRSVESGEFWTVAAEQRLAPLLYAAACTGKGIVALVRWAYGQGGHELLDTLENLVRGAESEVRRQDAQAAYDAAAAFSAQPERTRGSIEGTVQALLRVYRSGRVQRSAATMTSRRPACSTGTTRSTSSVTRRHLGCCGRSSGTPRHLGVTREA